MRKLFFAYSFAFLYLYNKLNVYSKSSLKLKNISSDLETSAICILEAPNNSTVNGVVMFTQKGVEAPTIITASVKGLKKNAKHGFHIHEWGDLSGGCTTAGAHYNPTFHTHGGPADHVRHVGDLGNLESNSEGNAIFERTEHLISLVGKYSVIGRSCVVHEDEDDLGKGSFPDSKTTGHSGARLACGVIALCDPNKSI